MLHLIACLENIGELYYGTSLSFSRSVLFRWKPTNNHKYSDVFGTIVLMTTTFCCHPRLTLRDFHPRAQTTSGEASRQQQKNAATQEEAHDVPDMSTPGSFESHCTLFHTGIVWKKRNHYYNTIVQYILFASIGWVILPWPIQILKSARPTSR